LSFSILDRAFDAAAHRRFRYPVLDQARSDDP
jgi:hypothetical protein